MTWGWQAAFYCIGALGLVWVVFWVRNYYDPEQHPRVSQGELRYVQQGVEPAPQKVPYSRILRMRGTWAFALAYTITAPVFWFYLYWLPPLPQPAVRPRHQRDADGHSADRDLPCRPISAALAAARCRRC
ncbi:hypothetical protein ACU4GD_03075 [Cupriavidus basilensis]